MRTYTCMCMLSSYEPAAHAYMRRVPDSDNFTTADLFDNKNFKQVKKKSLLDSVGCMYVGRLRVDVCMLAVYMYVEVCICWLYTCAYVCERMYILAVYTCRRMYVVCVYVCERVYMLAV